MTAQNVDFDDAASALPRKRARQDTELKSKSRVPGSKQGGLFAPFRALGLVTNNVPFVMQTRSHKGATEGPRIHIVTCTGKSWAMWEGGKMTLLFVGSTASEAISCLEMDGDAIWAVCGSIIIKYLRGKEVDRLVNPLESRLGSIITFGNLLLALTEDGTRMLTWDTVTKMVQSVIQFDKDFTATSILHPATYLNKVLVGSAQGDLQLWNIRTNTSIHKIPSSRILISPAHGSANGSGVAITALTQAPAIDVVGIGFANGEISVYDIRMDERLMRMFMDGGVVRTLSFRTDGHPVLASASSAGHIALWDLNSGGRLLHIVRGAHDGAVTAIEWVPGQPLLISSGEDNSVKQWLFDSPTSPPRLLKFRSGHHAPPHLIRYYGEDGKQLLTASRDRSLRCTSVVRDSRSFELSQGSLSKKASSLSIPLTSLKFPPIASLSYSCTRSKDWDDILTAHTDETFARTWTMLNKRLGKHTLGLADHGKTKKAPGTIRAVCVSACGNFGILGSSSGDIHMWNMQSGIKRKTFDMGPVPSEVANRSQNFSKKKGERSVTGLASDALNRVLLASTLDGTLNFFDFHSAKLEHTLILPTPVTSILLHRDSGLLAVVCDDMIVRIVDIETQRTVREFGGFRGRVLDMTFSPDSRWLVTTSIDSIIRTFDLPTGLLIDAFRTDSVATSISFSPTNDFLATAHVDSVGIFLWVNRAQFCNVSFHSLADDDVSEIPFPSMQGTDDVEEEALEALSALTVQDKPVDIFSTPPQLDGDLITLTLLPRSRWLTLLNLDVIQQRNKPKEPPKVPEKAPFFLPTFQGVESRFAVAPKEEKKPTRRLDKATANAESLFYSKLMAEEVDGDYDGFFSYTKSLTPAAIDLELRSLVTLDALHKFINAVTSRLRLRRDFEATQTLLNVFLRVYADEIIANEGLRHGLETLLKVQKQESQRILELIASSSGKLSFVRDVM